MKKRKSKQPDLIQTIQVRPDGNGWFEAYCDGHILGRSRNERLAIWTSVMAAEELAKSGRPCRVTAQKDGVETVEFTATPR